MLDLDKKVSRDTIFLAKDTELSGFFSSLKKKFKKITRKIGKAVLPKNIYKKLSAFESKHRKKLKILGGVALIATGAHFYGPKLLTTTKSLGGKVLAGGATKSVTKALVTAAIKAKLTRKAQKSLAKKVRQMTPPQVLQDPEIIKLSQEIAVAEAVNKERTKNKAAAALLVREGNIEVTHQIDKISTPKHLGMLTKVSIPIGIGLLALIL